MYFKWHMHWYDSNLWIYHKEITNYDWKMYMKEKIRFKKIAKMTVTENWDVVSYGHLSKKLWSVMVVSFTPVINVKDNLEIISISNNFYDDPMQNKCTEPMDYPL